MAEEMGIFIVNIASLQPGKAAPVPPPKGQPQPVAIPPKPANPNAHLTAAAPKSSSAPPMAGMPKGHSHGGRTMKVRSRRSGLMIDLPEAAEWIYV
jgi:hypothetical protein